MTKAEFVDLIIHGLTGGIRVDSQFRRYHPKLIALVVENALGQIFYDLFKRDPSQLDLFAKQFVDVPVAYDTNSRTMAATITSPVVQMTGNEGVRWVVDKANPQEKFIALSKDAAFNLHNLYANRIDDRPSFYLAEQKVFLSGFKKDNQIATGSIALTADVYYQVDGNGKVTYNNVDYFNGEVIKGLAVGTLDIAGLTGYLWEIMPPTAVHIGVIVPFSSLATTDQVIIPSGQNEYVMSFVKSYFNNLGFPDLSNNSKSEK